jgi:hypothetical protein
MIISWEKKIPTTTRLVEKTKKNHGCVFLPAGSENLKLGGSDDIFALFLVLHPVKGGLRASLTFLSLYQVAIKRA